MKKTFTWLFGLLALPGALLAQQSSGAEALHALVGEWSYDQIDGDVSCDMMGENWVHCRGSWINDAGNEVFAVFATGYQPADDRYVGLRFYGSGYMDSGRTWVDGNTWTTLYVNDNGIVRKFTGVLDGRTWAYHWEEFNADGEWERTSEGSMTRR